MPSARRSAARPTGTGSTSAPACPAGAAERRSRWRSSADASSTGARGSRPDMRRTPHFLLEDAAEVKRLIRENPWGTFVSSTSNGIVASHYPILLDASTGLSAGSDDGITIV